MAKVLVLRHNKMLLIVDRSACNHSVVAAGKKKECAPISLKVYNF